MVSSNVLSFCRRSSFCLVRVLMSVQVICFSWKTAGSLTKYRRRREEAAEAGPTGNSGSPRKESCAVHKAGEEADLARWAGAKPAENAK